jgi:hypothetical protein
MDVRTLAVVAAAAATFAVGALVASSLSSEPDPPSGPLRADDHGAPSGDDALQNAYVQAAMASYESRLLRYAQAEPDFTGARFAFRSRSLILYGSAAPSPVIRSLLDAPPDGVHVLWARVPYSRAELDRGLQRLRQAMPPRSVVEYAPNYSGLLVGLNPLPAAPGRQAALYSRAQRATEIPVTFLQAGFADPQ